MRTALVFGGSGQIGVPVIKRLRAAGFRVFAVSRAVQADSEGLTWLQGDLQQSRGLPPRVDAIFSLGPLDHFSRWYAATQLPAPRVIAFGSTSMDTKQDSSDAGERALAARLREAEARVLAAAVQKDEAVTLLRPTLIYGTGRDKTLTPVARLARRTGFFLLPRGASGLRQPVHVDDLADAALSVVDAERTHGRSYALPGGETLAYAQMVERTLAAVHPPARLIQVPALWFRTALAVAHATGRLTGLGDAAVARMRQDLVFDGEPARRDFGYSPRGFQPDQEMFSG